MKVTSPRNGVLIFAAVMVVSAGGTVFFGSPTAAVALLSVMGVGIAGALLTQALLNRRYVGRTRLIIRRPYLEPADLPPPPGILVGRDRELLQVCRLLQGPESPRARVVTIVGDEGVGKTALAVTAGHIVTRAFPDGQILVRFDTQRPDNDKHARAYFARALGTPAETPPEDREFGQWYRRKTHRKRILIVLDNVDDSVSVKRFLPTAPGCAVIVTSRRAVTEVSADLPVQLGLLDPAASRQLLRRLLGDRTETPDARQMEQIVVASAGHPAALQMAGAAIQTRRGWDLEVAFGEAQAIAIAAPEADLPPFVGVLNLACALLTDQERTCLALLSLLDTRRVAPWMLMALAQGGYPEWSSFDEMTAARILDRLARVRFAEVRIDERSGVAVYRIPRYTTEYARVLRASEVPEEGAVAALAAYRAGRDERSRQDPDLAHRVRVYQLLDQGRLDEALAVAREALFQASDDADWAATGADEETHLAEVALAEVFAELGWFDDALTYARAGAKGTETRTWVRALRIQGRVRWRLRQTGAAVAKLQQAEELARDLPVTDGAERVRVLRELTVAYTLAGECDKALASAGQAEKLCGSAEHRLPGVLWAYGLALTAARRYPEAEAVLERADTLSGVERFEQGLWRPWIRHQRAVLALEQKSYDTARSLAAGALSGFTALIHRYAAGHCRQLIGRAYLAERTYDQAIPALAETRQTFERCGDRWIEADTLVWLARAYMRKTWPDDVLRERYDEAGSMLDVARRTFEALKDADSVATTRAEDRELESRRGRLSRRTDRDPTEAGPHGDRALTENPEVPV
ncbi:NB-ARC domain-containing protein [Hamadaea tsunoensis]|uniref:NB-ARC domain-containing protein n=1 Tax=Hamadaea tsunoensis TaxID=53368 RepID=UPI000426799D|nr:NB-ARC domain-containing protein [Hamadaea tsunoensis]